MPLFTAATARENAAKSHEARRANSLAVKEARAAQRQLPQSESALAAGDRALDTFASKRLTRVRKQLDKLDRMIDEESDPAKLDRLASAQARLAEQERQLADRPLPGSKRPAQEPAKLSRAALLLLGSNSAGQDDTRPRQEQR